MKSTTSSQPFVGHVGPVTAVAFAGERLVTGGELGTVRVHDPASGAILASLDAHRGPVLAMVVSSDGGTLVTSSNDGTIRVVDPIQGAVLETFTDTNGRARDAGGALALSADDAWLISGSTDGGGASVWSTNDARLRARLEARGGSDWDGGVAITARGDRIFVGRGNGNVVVFDGASHQPVGQHRTPAGAGIDGLAVTPDGDELLVHRWPNGPIYVLDASTGESRGTLDVEGVRELALSADGTRVATGHRDGRVCVWDRAGRTLRFEWSEHRGAIRSLAWRTDGRQLLSGSDDGSACVWDVDRGALVTKLFGPRAMVRSLSMTSDGETLVSRDYSRGEIRVWNHRAATLRFALAPEGLGGATSCAITPDDRQLVVAAGHSIDLHDLASGDRVASFPVHECAVCMALTPDGEYVVSSCHQEMKVWSRRSGEVIASIPERAFALAITPDGQTMISGTNDGEARVWRYGEWQAPHRTFQHHEGVLVAIRVTRDGTTIVTGSGGGSLVCQELAAEQPRWRVARGLQNVREIVLASDEREVIAAGNANGAITAWDMATGKARGKLTDVKSWVGGLACTPDGTQLISAGHDGAIRVWQLDPEPADEGRRARR
jgi:WD40 repeat protein